LPEPRYGRAVERLPHLTERNNVALGFEIQAVPRG